MDGNCSNASVFESNQISQLIAQVIQGYNSTVFAYGQTSSGKTYTMEGIDYYSTSKGCQQTASLKPNINFEDQKIGIIPRAINHLFQQVNAENTLKERTYKVYVSYFQIYNERIYDLLNADAKKKEPEGQGLKLRWSKKDCFYVENLFSSQCDSPENALELLAKGMHNKIMASHRLNAMSSRSHSLFSLRVDSFNRVFPDEVVSAKLNLVDLAGSELQSLTGTEGQRYKECIEINKSLFTLRQVITALSSKDSKTHVPYRNSKLTSLLKNSIGGNSYCLMIACLSPCDNYFEENLSTLNYAAMAGTISNKPIKNEDPRNVLIQQQKKIISQLTKDLARANQHIEYLSQKLDPINTIEFGSESFQEKSRVSSYQVETENTEKRMQKDSGKASKILIQADMKSKLLESAQMVRELLKSNAQIREMSEVQTNRNNQLEADVSELEMENIDLREKIEIMEDIMKETIKHQRQKQQLSDTKYDYPLFKGEEASVLENNQESITTAILLIQALKKDNRTLSQQVSTLQEDLTFRMSSGGGVEKANKEKENGSSSFVPNNYIKLKKKKNQSIPGRQSKFQLISPALDPKQPIGALFQQKQSNSNMFEQQYQQSVNKKQSKQDTSNSLFRYCSVMNSTALSGGVVRQVQQTPYQTQIGNQSKDQNTLLPCFDQQQQTEKHLAIASCPIRVYQNARQRSRTMELNNYFKNS